MYGSDGRAVPASGGDNGSEAALSKADLLFERRFAYSIEVLLPMRSPGSHSMSLTIILLRNASSHPQNK